MSSARSDNKAPQTCVIKSTLAETQAPKDRILAELRRHHFREDAIFAIKLALEEALTNAVKHGNRCDPCKCVTVRFAVSDEEAVISIRDEGAGFVPGEVPDCTSPDRLPMPNGRGIMLMRAYMDEVRYQDNGREVVFVKKRNSPTTPAPEQAAPSPQRRTLYYSGNVQGVGFRYTAQRIAAKLPVTGYVRNLPDGRVELVAEGTFADLDRFQSDVEQAMSGCIEHLEASGSPATGEFKGFSIRH